MTWCNKFGIHYLLNGVLVSLLFISISCIIFYEHSYLHILHCTWLRCIRSCTVDLSHGFLKNRWLVHNRFIGLSNLLEVVVHHLLIGGITGLGYRDGFPMASVPSVYGYTLDRSYNESCLKAIKYSWPHQVVSLCCISTLREYWACTKVNNDFDLRVIS